MADIVLVNPKFEPSFWGMEHAMPLFGKRANLPSACLPLLAALTPSEHTVTLMDENVEPIDYDRIEQADIVGLTGMIVQRSVSRVSREYVPRRRAFKNRWIAMGKGDMLVSALLHRGWLACSRATIQRVSTS